MSRSRTTLLLTGAIMIVGVAIAGLLAAQKKPLKVAPRSGDREAVEVIAASNSDLSYRFEVSGTISAWNKIDLYAEVSGILEDTEIPFREGQAAQGGQVLIRVDDAVYANTLMAEKSSLLTDLTKLLADVSIDFPEREPVWKEYLDNFRLDQPLQPLPEPASTKERNYVAARNIYLRFHSIEGMTAQLNKYTIKAPFTGVITEANIKPGTLVRNGQKLGEFCSTADFELKAGVGLGEIDHISVGDQVTLISADRPGTFRGVIERVNNRIEPRSQTVSVYIRIRDDRLRDGMYLTATLQSTEQADVVRLPKALLVSSNSLFVIRDSLLALQEVEVVAETGDDVLVRNIADGTLVLAEDIEGAIEGMKIHAYTVSERD